MNLLRQLDEINEKTGNQYFEIIENIVAGVKASMIYAQDILKRIEDQNKESIIELVSLLTHLEKAKWIDEYKPGTYSDTLSKTE